MTERTLEEEIMAELEAESAASGGKKGKKERIIRLCDIVFSW